MLIIEEICYFERGTEKASKIQCHLNTFPLNYVKLWLERFARSYKLNWKECKRFEFSKTSKCVILCIIENKTITIEFSNGKLSLKWLIFKGIYCGANFPSLTSHYFTWQLISLWLSLIFSTSEFSSVIQRLLNLGVTFLYKKLIKTTWLDHG